MTDEEPIDYHETIARINAYASAKVREATEALSKENADLRARLEAIRKSFGWNRGTFEGDFETLLERALDLTRPFKEGV